MDGLIRPFFVTSIFTVKILVIWNLNETKKIYSPRRIFCEKCLISLFFQNNSGIQYGRYSIGSRILKDMVEKSGRFR